MSYNLNCFPVKKNGYKDSSSGAVTGNIAVALEDSEITITWNDDTTSTRSIPMQFAFDMLDMKSFTITSGSFEVA